MNHKYVFVLVYFIFTLKTFKKGKATHKTKIIYIDNIF